MKRTYSQIDMDERRKIARWRMAGVGVEVIAEKTRTASLDDFPRAQTQYVRGSADAGPQRLLLRDGEYDGT